jgi:protein-S-isoprenylcysteine O-methyltransferase Ste14
MNRIIVLLYGLISYLIGVAGLAAIVVTLAGLMPWGFLLQGAECPVSPITVNICLIAVWGFIHTGMARQSFKDVVTKIIPTAAERATYVLVAGITSIALVGFWHHVPGQIWQLQEGLAASLIWGVFWFGWVFLLASSFAINHFDLFGLRQVYLHYKQQPEAPLAFVKRAMYQYIRHPIQTGVLIGVWATPSMTANHFILSAGFTAYIVVGLWFEERDLIKVHGQDYTDYKQEAGKLFPRISS